MLTEGFCKLHRGILKYFKKPFTENEAWIWMITQADYRDGEKYGVVEGTMRQFGEAWGRDKKTVSRWLHKWRIETSPRISCEYAAFPRDTKSGEKIPASLHNNHATDPCHCTTPLTCATDITTITLLNYGKFQRTTKKTPLTCATIPATDPCHTLKGKELRTKKNYPDSDESVSPNSRVYNFFIEQKRSAHNRPEWLPTATQAKQLRANIKVLIEKQGFKSEDLIAFLKNFFSDEKIKEAGWPWKFFMTDPVRWKTAREPPPVPPSHRPWNSSEERT